MIILTLEEIKRHLRWPDTDPDSEEDPYLEDLEAAAVDHVADYLGQPVPFEADSEHSGPWVPPAVRHALLIIIADLYENRQSKLAGVSVSTLDTVQELLHFKRVGLGI